VSRRAGERNPVLLAVNGLVAIALVLAVAASWRRLPFVDSSVAYRAEFADASGLVPGEEVRVSGVKVGTVRTIELAGDHVVVGFDVSDVVLGDRTEAGIEVKTLLGQHYLSVTPVGEDPLPEDALIPLDRTTTPMNIVPAFDRLSGQVARTDTDQVAAAFDALSATLRRTAPEMGSALTGLSRLSRTVTRHDDQIAELFDRADRVTGVVSDRDQELGQLLTASQQVLATLDQRRAVIRGIIRDTAALATQLRGLVDDNEAVLRPALRDLATVTRVLRRSERQLDQTLTYAAPYAREFTNVGGSGEWFDATMKFPRGFALCGTGDSTDPTGGLLDGLLSASNGAVNGSDQPCLPLGPAVSSALTEGLPGRTAPRVAGDRP